jgi:hypothetical protein
MVALVVPVVPAAMLSAQEPNRVARAAAAETAAPGAMVKKAAPRGWPLRSR